MSNYTLEPYKGKNTRYRCPQCQYKGVFVRYIHRSTGQHLAEEAGRCNREVNCGYHLSPGQYLHARGDNHSDAKPLPPIIRMQAPARPSSPSFHPFEVVLDTLRSHQNHLITYLMRRFTVEQVWQALHDYEIGTHHRWPGATVFWQHDIQKRTRYGKIMLYNPETGKRVKEPYPHFTTMHSVLGLKDFNLVQCLFGEHLLRGNTRPVGIVESEKTAIICSMRMPDILWLATGGLGGLTAEKCQVLHGHKAILFPDANAHDKWAAKARELQPTIHLSISRMLETTGTETDKTNGLDLADYLVAA